MYSGRYFSEISNLNLSKLHGTSINMSLNNLSFFDEDLLKNEHLNQSQVPTSRNIDKDILEQTTKLKLDQA